MKRTCLLSLPILCPDLMREIADRMSFDWSLLKFDDLGFDGRSDMDYMMWQTQKITLTEEEREMFARWSKMSEEDRRLGKWYRAQLADIFESDFQDTLERRQCVRKLPIISPDILREISNFLPCSMCEYINKLKPGSVCPECKSQ